MTTTPTYRPPHRPECFEAPVPGRQWYSGCDPDGPRVTLGGVCLGCGERACPECGREDCPDHVEALWPEGWHGTDQYDLVDVSRVEHHEGASR